MEQKIEAPTPAELHAIAHQLMHAAELVSEATGLALSGTTADLAALQKVVDSKIVEPEATYSLQALGLAFGKVFIETRGALRLVDGRRRVRQGPCDPLQADDAAAVPEDDAVQADRGRGAGRCGRDLQGVAGDGAGGAGGALPGRVTTAHHAREFASLNKKKKLPVNAPTEIKAAIALSTAVVVVEASQNVWSVASGSEARTDSDLGCFGWSTCNGSETIPLGAG
jgi:hypothetical protein